MSDVIKKKKEKDKIEIRQKPVRQMRQYDFVTYMGWRFLIGWTHFLNPDFGEPAGYFLLDQFYTCIMNE